MMHIPLATYRLQLTPSFGFKKVEEILPYLSALGISDIYVSPIFKPRKGSTHGYDVVDPNQLNPELGSIEEFEKLHASLKKIGMFWLQDIVPNHMAFDSANHMLMNIFEIGECSPFFNVFDIDWTHSFENMRGKVMAPFLGKFYGKCLEDGELQLKYDDGKFSINYYQLKFPLKISSYPIILEHDFDRLEEKLGKNDPTLIKFLGTLYFLKNIDLALKSPTLGDQINLAKITLWRLFLENPAIRGFIEGNLRFFNGKVGDPQSFDALDRILSEQMFRLSFWKAAGSEINYRRFFNINELISIKIEDPEVIPLTHNLIFQLLEEGKLGGLRIDHIDGLANPEIYLEQLRKKAPNAYILVEKILEGSEVLPISWPVQGTTGYDVLNLINHVFCKIENEEAFKKIYENIFPAKESPEELFLEKQRLIISGHLRGNINNLALYVKKIASNDRYGRDLTLDSLKKALVEVLTFFPVYRSYIHKLELTDEDRSHINEAVEKSLEKQPDLFYELEFIRKFFLLQFGENQPEEEKQEWLNLVMQLQQYTGPLMAKGVEDTFFYVYNRLVSLNEVGGNPINFGVTREQMHQFFLKRQSRYLNSMNASATHDTKRGEDVRARINVLSEIPQEWAAQLKQWKKTNRQQKTFIRGFFFPDENDEYFIYQTLIGAMPFSGISAAFIQRIKDYTIKAIREAKVHTDWVQQNSEYEKSCLSFIESLFKNPAKNKFLEAFLPFQKKIAVLGAYNSLSQTLLKITLPGVPDFYQGCELWDLSLVDPDNRRTVDFSSRKALLDEIQSRFEGEKIELTNSLLSDMENGKAKLFLIWRALHARSNLQEVFLRGDYRPIESHGTFSECIISFLRTYQGKKIAVVASRFFSRLCEDPVPPIGSNVWKDTQIDFGDVGSGNWRDLITDRQIKGTNRMFAGEVLRYFPVSLLLIDSA